MYSMPVCLSCTLSLNYFLEAKACSMCRAALVQLAEDENWPAGWVFDGRKNIYAPLEFSDSKRFRFLGQDEQSFEVRRLWVLQITLQGSRLMTVSISTVPQCPH